MNVAQPLCLKDVSLNSFEFINQSAIFLDLQVQFCFLHSFFSLLPQYFRPLFLEILLSLEQDNADMHLIHIIACPCGCFCAGQVEDLVPFSYEPSHRVEATEVKELLDHVGRLAGLFSLSMQGFEAGR